MKLFDVIHSVDRPSLLDALVKEAEKADRSPSVYVQVNIGEEEQKGGCAISDVGDLVEAVRASPLPLAGLMAIPPLGVEPRSIFRSAGQACGGQRPDGPEHGHVRRLQACGDAGRDGGPDRNRLVRRLRAARLCADALAPGSCTDPVRARRCGRAIAFRWRAVGGARSRRNLRGREPILRTRTEGQGPGAGRIRVRRERGRGAASSSRRSAESRVADSTVILTVGDQPFMLATTGRWAWSRDSAQEAAIIAAVRAASGMRIESRDAPGGAIHRPLSARRRSDGDRRCGGALRSEAGKISAAITR